MSVFSVINTSVPELIQREKLLKNIKEEVFKRITIDTKTNSIS